MKIIKYILITLVTLVLIGSAGYLYAAGGLKSKPGYADLVLPGWLSTDTALAVRLGPGGLKPVRWVVNRVIENSHNKSDLSKLVLTRLLDDLEGVQLRIYEVKNNQPVFDQAIDDSIMSLIQQDWQILVRLREHEEHIVIMQSAEAGLIRGLSILASTPENAVFINLVGQLSPESISEIADNLNPA